MRQVYTNANKEKWTCDNWISLRINSIFYTKRKELNALMFQRGHIEKYTTNDYIKHSIFKHKIITLGLYSGFYVVEYSHVDKTVIPFVKDIFCFYTRNRREAYKKMIAIMEHNDFTNME